MVAHETGARESESARVLLGIDEIRRLFQKRELSPVELVDGLASAIERTQPVLNAFVTLCLDRGRGEAEVAERRFGAGDERPLEGIPIAVKDLLDTKGVRTTYGSSMFDSNVPASDAVAVRRVREAGAIVVGKTATHEFAWGITCDNPHYGPCTNPWDPTRISGGSSGGSAAALGAGLVPVALGSDTGGSIRIPAAFCGVIGLKAGFGRVNASGTFPLAPSLDHVGPMARRPRDLWQLYRVLAEGGHPTGAEDSSRGLAGLRIASCPDLHGGVLSEGVERALARTLAVSSELGADTVEVAFKDAAGVIPAFATIQRAEALDSHRRRGLFPRRISDYGEDLRDRLGQATKVGLADYLAATRERARVEAAFATLFERADLLLTPVSPVSPLRVGEPTTVDHGRQADFRALVLGATSAQNLAGLPACTVRADFDRAGLPIGLQITGPRGSEARVVAAAEAVFHATPAIQNRIPQVAA